MYVNFELAPLYPCGMGWQPTASRKRAQWLSRKRSSLIPICNLTQDRLRLTCKWLLVRQIPRNHLLSLPSCIVRSSIACEDSVVWLKSWLACYPRTVGMEGEGWLRLLQLDKLFTREHLLFIMTWDYLETYCPTRVMLCNAPVVPAVEEG